MRSETRAPVASLLQTAGFVARKRPVSGNISRNYRQLASICVVIRRKLRNVIGSGGAYSESDIGTENHTYDFYGDGQVRKKTGRSRLGGSGVFAQDCCYDKDATLIVQIAHDWVETPSASWVECGFSTNRYVTSFILLAGMRSPEAVDEVRARTAATSGWRPEAAARRGGGIGPGRRRGTRQPGRRRASRRRAGPCAAPRPSRG